jgi:2-furoyl-CoA dehydrogenase FAD binding subunit
VKPRPFSYIRPESVAEALDVLAHYNDRARVLAGGQSLIAMLNLRLADAEAIVDVSRLAELTDIRLEGDMLEVGAAVTQNRLLAWHGLHAHVPLLGIMMPWIGHFQTRNRGTVCGSLAHADPSSELPLALALLGGSVVLKSKRGTRTLTAGSFQTGLLSTAREDDELIVAARFPSNGTNGIGFREMARRRGDFAIVAIAAMRTGAREMRVGFGGVSMRPFVSTIEFDDRREAVRAVENLVAQFDGYEDMHASAQMRRDLVLRMAPKVFEEALA